MQAKSVIELWLWGGPSSLETFDPKPDAPFDYNNGLKAIDTNVPGMKIHEWWPELAKCANLYSLVRTMTHPHFGHETATYLMQTGRNPGGGEVYPAIGAVISMMKAKDYHGDLPPFVILTTAKGRFSEVGFLGEKYAPLVTGGDPRQAKFVVDGIVPPGALSDADIARRFDLLKMVDQFGGRAERRDFEDAGVAARKIIEGDAAKTFDLSQEKKETRDRYGRTWIGQTLLAARRLVEYGVPYITVNMSGWDSHKRHFETMKSRTNETDRALAALLGDLSERGLLDSTVIWVSGEFGRTTKIDRDPPWNGGRNHYPKCFSALLAGGGFKGGCVVGESDATASNVVKRPVTPVDFLGSIYERCGINPDGPMPNSRGKKLTVLPPQSKLGRLKELYAGAALAVTLGFAALFGVPSAFADPYVGYISPAGIQAGTTNRVIIGGQNILGAKDGFISGGGVHVLKVERVPNFAPPLGTQRKYLMKWLKGIALGDRTRPPIPANERVNEWRSNVWWQALCDLDDLEISLVENYLEHRPNPLQQSPSLRQRLIVTIAADADAKVGWRELRLCNGQGFSPPRPFQVTAAPHTEEPLYAAEFRPRPKTPRIAAYPAVIDGTIMPGETDRWILHLEKGKPVTLRTVGRELQPYIGDAVPGFFNPALRLVSPDGKEVAFADDYFYQPDPQLVITPPETGDYTLEIHDVLYRGREDFVYAIAAETGKRLTPVNAVPLWPKLNCDIPSVEMVAEFKGTVAPRRLCEHRLDIAKSGDYVFDLLARRAGSPLDAKLTILDDDGCVVATFADNTDEVHCGSIIQGECDPVGKTYLAAGEYVIKVEDEAGKGGADFAYDLRVHRPAPRFEVWTNGSGVVLRPANSKRITVHVLRRDGFKGAVEFADNEYLSFSPRVIPANTNVLKVVVSSKQRVPVASRTIDIFARAKIGAETMTVRVIPADEYNQAFAWNHLLPSAGFAFQGIGKWNGQGKNKNGQGKNKNGKGQKGKGKGKKK